jgi:DNA-binding transcriptional MerR regulator
MANSGIQIGRVSKQTGLSVDAIRFYEKQRLLERPPRTDGGLRLFNGRDIQRIHFIRRAQQLGFSLLEIRELLILQRRDEGEICPISATCCGTKLPRCTTKSRS